MATNDGPPLDLGRLIGAFDRHGVKYLVCGGVAATAYGAERPTEDADCVVSRERTNLDRLAEAMRELNARLRVARMTDSEAKLLPVQIDGATLADLSITTWMTDAGPFDVLAGLESPDGRLVTYEELARQASVLQGRDSSYTPPAWMTSSEQRNVSTGPRIVRLSPSCALYVTPAMLVGEPIPGDRFAGIAGDSGGLSPPRRRTGALQPAPMDDIRGQVLQGSLHSLVDWRDPTR